MYSDSVPYYDRIYADKDDETEEIREVLVEAGLEVQFDPEGLIGRGMFIGRKAR